MKPCEKALDEKTVQQAIEAIGDRVNALGVSEPVIQQYGLGANQILVELPGVSDLDRVRASSRGPRAWRFTPLWVALILTSRRHLPAWAAPSGRRGIDARLRSWRPVPIRIAFMFCSASPIVAGSDFRSADPGTDSNTGQRNVHFTLTDEAGDKFYDYTSANVGQSMAVVMGGRVREVATIKSAIRDSGEIEGSFSQDEVTDALQAAEHGRIAGLADLS